jgi:hypothetical protein
VKVTIDRVVLTNVSLRADEAEAFRGAVTAELMRLVEARGLPGASSAESRDAPLAKGETLADSVASSLYSALRKGG